MGGAVDRFSSMLKKAAGAAVAYLAVRQVVRFAQSSLEAFGRQEQAIRKLSDSLDQLGAGGKRAMADMEAFAATIQKQTTIGDEAALELASLGASLGRLSGEGLKAATVAAIGLSERLKVDTTAAMRLVARAAVGDTQMLARYGLKLNETLTPQEKFNELLRLGGESFDLARGQADTYAGRMDQVRNLWGDMKEMLGKVLAPALMSIGQWFIRVFTNAEVVVENFGEISRIVWTKFKLGATESAREVYHFFAKQLPETLSWFFRNWKDVFTTLWNFTKTVFVNMGKNIAEFFRSTWAWLKGEGFDFKWTGLLEGFESTLKELPKIIERVIPEDEKRMRAEIDKLAMNLATAFNTKMAERMGMMKTDLAAGAKAGGFELPIKLKDEAGPNLKKILDDFLGGFQSGLRGAATTRGGVEAITGRFRTQAGQYFRPETETARNTKRMIAELKKIAKSGKATADEVRGLIDAIRNSRPQMAEL